MKKLRRRIFATAGSNTVSLGTGRKEFHPKKPRPGLEHYVKEAGQGALAQVNDADNIDEGVIGNFMAARFNKQGNLPGLLPMIDPKLEYKPLVRVEGACGSGGLALVTATKSILAETADTVLAVGVEVQNTVKAVYGADILGGAGHYASQRKKGDAYFFPGKFSDRACAAYEKFGYDKVREAMARWYERAILNARTCPKAQEYHNTTDDLFAVGMTPPNPKAFCECINYFDCSKVSDGASALVFASEEGLDKLGVDKKDAVELVGFGQCVADVSKDPEDQTKLTTSARAVKAAMDMAGVTSDDIGMLEVHDCFTIGGLLSMEAAGFCDYGETYDFVREGKTAPDGEIPTNLSGGLIGYGHYTGGTGVRQAADIVLQLTGKPESQKIDLKKDHALMISMGGNDRTVVSCVFRRVQ
ncbi:MAG: 3-ketoacyl-CoA thiolase [Candidatus Eisenbacteria bacterium]|nr:3-ketoacyl-CoA thiolase [Candidatus Eisenbacteria bacterium]